MDAAAEIGRNPVSKHSQIQPELCRMSRLTRDGTAEPVSRDKFLMCGDRETFIFSVQLTTSRISNLTRLIHTLLFYVMTIHTSLCLGYSSVYLQPKRRSSMYVVYVRIVGKT